MTNLTDFVTTLYPADYGQEESIKIAKELEGLSIQELAGLAGVQLPLTEVEKRAYDTAIKASSHDDDESWLSQFEGTPLQQAAIQLCEQDLEMRAKHLQKRIERRRRDDYEDEWTERDQLGLQKKRLELALHKHKATSMGTGAASAGTQPAAPAPQEGAPQTATSASGAGMMAQNEAKTASVRTRFKKIAAGRSEVQQNKGLAKAVAGLKRSKMDPDRKRGLMKGLGKAVGKEMRQHKLAHNPLFAQLREKIARAKLISRGVSAAKRVAAKPPPIPAMTAGGKPVLRRSGPLTAAGRAAREKRLQTLQAVERMAAR